MCKLSPSDKEMQKWQKTISVWIEIAIYHQQDQSRLVWAAPSSHSCSSLTFLTLDLESSSAGCYLLSLPQAAIPQQPLSAGTRRELPACSSGPENIWRTQIITICWKSPTWKVRERPELSLQHLKHQKWYLRPAQWGGRTKKYCRYGGRTCSSECCTIPSSRAAAPEGRGKYFSEEEQGSCPQ